MLYGVLTLTLVAGDAFHLIPRIVKAVRGTGKRVQWFMNLGLIVTSVTMTLFYVLLLYIWQYTFPQLTAPGVLKLVIWCASALRILVCLLPQNNWFSESGSP